MQRETILQTNLYCILVLTWYEVALTYSMSMNASACCLHTSGYVNRVGEPTSISDSQQPFLVLDRVVRMHRIAPFLWAVRGLQRVEGPGRCLHRCGQTESHTERYGGLVNIPNLTVWVSGVGHELWPREPSLVPVTLMHIGAKTKPDAQNVKY